MKNLPAILSCLLLPSLLVPAPLLAQEARIDTAVVAVSARSPPATERPAAVSEPAIV